jgi:hypothetical protein
MSLTGSVVIVSSPSPFLRRRSVKALEHLWMRLLVPRAGQWRTSKLRLSFIPSKKNSELFRQVLN